jgi:hypothetical protein
MPRGIQAPGYFAELSMEIGPMSWSVSAPPGLHER